ncbi:MAG: hypothetical protein ACTSRR_07520 [Candidatus Heimdallarchaeaceae archaeon]
MKNLLSVKLVGMITILLFFFIALETRMYVYGQNYNIKSINETPSFVTPETNVTITIEAYSSEDISYIRLFFCQLSPDFICDTNPVLMEQNGDIFSGNYYVTQEAGSTIGYHFIVYYENGTNILLPNSLDFLGIDNIVQPTTDSYYIKIDVNEPTAEKTPVCLGTSLLALFVVPILRKKFT